MGWRRKLWGSGSRIGERICCPGPHGVRGLLFAGGKLGQKLLLVGKAGEKEDLDTLYGYLDSPSPVLQARAMQAIAALESKASAAVRKD